VAYVLLQDGRLEILTVPDGTQLGELSLGEPDLARASPSHALVLSEDGRTLYALIRASPDRLAVIDTVGLQLRSSVGLTGGIYQGLGIGSRTGRLYLFGNRGTNAVLTVLDASLAMVSLPTAIRTDAHTWTVYRGLVSADESQVWLSYHSPDTSGIDRIRISDLTRVCPTASDGRGCIKAHGDVEAGPGGTYIATTGEGDLLEFDADGRQLRAFDPTLPGNHLMEFAVDPDGRFLYPVGSCGYAGGLSVISLANAQTHVLVAARTPAGAAVCGSRISAGHGVLAIARTDEPAGPRAPASLLILQTDGTVVSRIATSAAIADVLVASR
jgi:DNA-binding beta-propeller fold protein YncE